MANLDNIDRRLLAELQAEGRVTNVELAQRVGLTAPPCLRRVRALEESGVIRGYHADLDASKLGFAITVFAMVSLKSQAVDSLIFYPIAFYGIWTNAQIATVMVTNWLLKVLWEVLLTPVTYSVVGWLKRREGVEVFDKGTDFSPFAKAPSV